MRTTLRAAALFLVLASGCVSASQSGTPGMAGRSKDRITEEEIRASRAANAFELVQALHADWLRKRSSTTALRASGVSRSGSDDIVVYLDGQRLGYLDTMRAIQATDLSSVRRLSAGDAQQRYGDGHPNGVIELVTRRGGT
jgi:hypothetical protein